MTFEELAATLPNGFHDAELRAIAIDFTQREARLTLNIWIGDDEDREACRLADVILSGLIYWVSEVPDALHPYGEADAVTIDAGLFDKLSPEMRPKLPPVPQGAFTNWLFVVDWNAFMYVVAENAVLNWRGDKNVR